MLQKSKSGKVLKLKYLALVPLVAGMLFYTSCETEKEADKEVVQSKGDIEVVSVDVPFSIVEEVPVFPGCEDALETRDCFNDKIDMHIKKNFRYPEEAMKEGVEGRVSVRFVIQEDGSIGDIQMRGPDVRLEEEALRIIKLLPNIIPGKQRGHNVRVPFSLPITFRLQ